VIQTQLEQTMHVDTLVCSMKITDAHVNDTGRKIFPMV